ncbi:MAG TPA: fumarylacetoacetate hydrolase family protein [Trinickia sp.]|nr:fumarylacetoacetate hydrolase family protein [Trinickia sp.]
MRLSVVTDQAGRTPHGEVELKSVYGALLNFRSALAALGDAVNAAPYGKPPQAPILYIKPANTHAHDGASAVVPGGFDALEIGATLGVVFGRRATRVAAADALGYVLGYTVVADLSVPHPSYYRPAVRFKCRDGYCPIGPCVVARDAVRDPDHLSLTVRVNGETRLETNTSDLVRPVAQLIADVTSFMSLDAGDVLLIGVPANAPRARAGDKVEIAIGEVGTLTHTLVAEKHDAPREVR